MNQENMNQKDKADDTESSEGQPAENEANEAKASEEAASAEAPSFLTAMFSVMAAAIGVQSSKNRERDFTQGNPLVFIAAGLLFTVLFISTLVGVVYLVL